MVKNDVELPKWLAAVEHCKVEASEEVSLKQAHLRKEIAEAVLVHASWFCPRLIMIIRVVTQTSCLIESVRRRVMRPRKSDKTKRRRKRQRRQQRRSQRGGGGNPKQSRHQRCNNLRRSRSQWSQPIKEGANPKQTQHQRCNLRRSRAPRSHPREQKRGQ